MKSRKKKAQSDNSSSESGGTAAPVSPCKRPSSRSASPDATLLTRPACNPVRQANTTTAQAAPSAAPAASIPGSGAQAEPRTSPAPASLASGAQGSPASGARAHPSAGDELSSSTPARKRPASADSNPLSPGVEVKPPPIRYGLSTVYTDMQQQQWRLKRRPGHRQGGRALIVFKWTNSDPCNVWAEVCAALRTYNPWKKALHPR